jgi:hypothetical protein
VFESDLEGELDPKTAVSPTFVNAYFPLLTNNSSDPFIEFVQSQTQTQLSQDFEESQTLNESQTLDESQTQEEIQEENQSLTPDDHDNTTISQMTNHGTPMHSPAASMDATTSATTATGTESSVEFQDNQF